MPGGNLVRSPRYKKRSRAPRSSHHARYYYTRSLVIEPSYKKPHPPLRCLSAPRVMDSHSRSASPREPSRPQHRPPSPPTPPGVENKAFQPDEDRNHNVNDSFTSNGHTQNGVNGHSKEPNGHPTTNAPEAVNLELINLSPKNGKKKDVEVDMSASNPYDEYFVPVNEHRKYMRGEKLYVTADKRGEKNGCKRPLCWTLLALVVAAVVALIILAATGVLFASTPTPVEPYNGTVSSARALGGIAQSHDQDQHNDFSHENHEQSHEEHNHGTITEKAAPKHVHETQNDAAVIPESNESSDSSMYVPRTVEGELKIDSEEFTLPMGDPESDEYQEFASNFAEQLKRAIFDRATLENGSHDIMLEIIKLREGSVMVTYRIHWKSKSGAEADDEFITAKSVKDRLDEYLMKNSRMINVYHIAEDKMSTRYVLDLCQINKNDCEYGCMFDESSLDFMCTCPAGEIADMNHPKKCISIFEATSKEHTKPKDFKVLNIDTGASTTKPVSEEERPYTESVKIAHASQDIADQVFEWKENKPTNVETTTMDTDPGFIYSRVFGIPSEGPHNDDLGTPKPDTDHGHHTISHVEPAPEPTSEPEPAAEPKAEPEPFPALEPTPVVNLNSERISEPTSVPEPTAEPTAEPAAEPTTEPTAEPTVAPTAESTPEPTAEPTAEPVAEPMAEPTVKSKVEPESSTDVTNTNSTEPISVQELEPVGAYSTTEALHLSEKPTTKAMWQLISDISGKSQESGETEAEHTMKSQAEPIAEPEPTTERSSSSEMYDKSAEERNHQSSVEMNINENYHRNDNHEMGSAIASEKETAESVALNKPSLRSKQSVITTDNESTSRNNNESSQLFYLSEKYNDNEWLENENDTNINQETHSGESNDTKSDTHSMDVIKENMNNDDKHETQQRSFNLPSGDDQQSNKENEQIPITTMASRDQSISMTETSVAVFDVSSNDTSYQTVPENVTNMNVTQKDDGNEPTSSSSDINSTETVKYRKVISFLSPDDTYNTSPSTLDVVSEPAVTSTHYSISKQFETDNQDKDLMQALDTHTTDLPLETTSEKDYADDTADITFDSISMLYNRSSKAILDTIGHNNTENEAELNLKSQTTTESDWLSEFVTEVNFYQVMNSKETTETSVTKIEDMMNHASKDDFEPDYLNTLEPGKSSAPDLPIYGMVHDYDTEDPRVKRVNAASKAKTDISNETISEDGKDIIDGIATTTTTENVTAKTVTRMTTTEAEKAVTETTKVYVQSDDKRNNTLTSLSETTTARNVVTKTMDDSNIKNNAASKNSSSELAYFSMSTMNASKERNFEHDPSSELEHKPASPVITFVEHEDEKTFGTSNAESRMEDNNITTLRTPMETTTVVQYVYESSKNVAKDFEVIPHTSSSASSVSNVTSELANDPAPVWEEYEYEPMIRDQPEKMNEDTSAKFQKDIIFNSSVSQGMSANVTKSIQNQHTNMTQSSNLNVTIYEVPSQNNESAIAATNSSTSHSTEYEDHETEMNPFLPEVENNKSLVKKLQEGHDLDVVVVNETQNENTEEHNSPAVEGNPEIQEKVVTGTVSKLNVDEDRHTLFHETVDDHSNSEVMERTKDEDHSTINTKSANDETQSKQKLNEKSNLPVLTFLKDTDDLSVYRDHTTEQNMNVGESMEDTTNSPDVSVEDNNATYKSSLEIDSDYLSVVPIEEEKKIEEKQLQNIHKQSYKSESSHELNDISDSPKKSDRRTLGANKL